jgi:hypothetical protein
MSFTSLLADALGVLDPIQKRMFIVEMPNFTLPYDYIQAVNIPLPSINSISQTQKGFRVNYPFQRTLDQSTFSITFYEDQSLPILSYYMQWCNQVINLSTYNFNVPANYKRPIVIYIIDSDISPVATISMLGCYPANIVGYNFRLGDDSPVMPTIQFYTDAAEVTIVGSPSFLLGGISLGNIQNLAQLPFIATNVARNIAIGGASQIATGITYGINSSLSGFVANLEGNPTGVL